MSWWYFRDLVSALHFCVTVQFERDIQKLERRLSFLDNVIDPQRKAHPGYRVIVYFYERRINHLKRRATH